MSHQLLCYATGASSLTITGLLYILTFSDFCELNRLVNLRACILVKPVLMFLPCNKVPQRNLIKMMLTALDEANFVGNIAELFEVLPTPSLGKKMVVSY